MPRLKPDSTLVHDGDASVAVDAWLVPSLGYPDELPDVIGEATPRFGIDAGNGPLKQVPFFRAPARLSLPGSEVSHVGVIALIRRPGGGSKQVISLGPFKWPAEENLALRVIEQLIQAHAEQWRPQAQLWSAPAEVLLAEDFDQRS